MSNRGFPVRERDAGRKLGDFLSDQLRLTRAAVDRLIRANQVTISGSPCADPREHLQLGQHISVSFESAEKPASIPQPTIVFADADIAVVNKPSGLTTMRHAHEAAEFGRRARRFLPPTLQDLLPDLLNKGEPRPVRAVHRLDNETSGLVVFARTATAEANLGRQFRAHSTERLYCALVRGRPSNCRFDSTLVRDRGDGRRGSGTGADAQHAVTQVRVIEPLGEFALVECRLETGRTHQVRIHLGEAGFPLCGERVYDRPLHGQPLPDHSGATRIMLHAATLGFDHPATGQRVRWEAPPPKDMANLLKRLRSVAKPRTT